MYQALYRKWRPLKFADVIGQQHITDTLRAQLQSGRLSHAYLFSGTRGTGKTTCAKILARAVNCENPQNGDPCGECAACRGILDGSVLDVVEIDAASNNGVDNIREIRDETRYTPSSVKKRVYIIDEVHMLSVGAFNALLKTLEEPPPHVMFVLATTEIHKVPATILSRCQRFDFRRITPEDIARRLLQIAAEEKIQLTEGGAKLIARLADGAMRDALSMLDRTAGCEIVDEDAISRSIGILGSNDAIQLMDCIKNNDLSGAVLRIGEAYDAGRDLSGVFDQMLGLIRDMLLVKTSKNDVSALLSPAYPPSEVARLCEGAASSTLIAWAHILQETQARLKSAANRRVEAELAIIRLCSLGADDYDSLTGRVDALEEKVQNGIVAVAPAVVQKSEMQDAPPWDEEKKPPEAQAKPEKQPQQEEASEETAETWTGWPKLLTMLDKKISRGTLTCLKISARAVYEDHKLMIFAEDSVTAGLAKAADTKACIEENAAILIGEPVKVRIYEPGEKPQKREKNDELDALLSKAKSMDIEIREF